jgi:hypothetical protein
MAEYFASNTGTGTACTQAAPCAPATWIADSTKCAPGNILWLNDGVYTGTAYMIRPGSVAPGRSGLDTPSGRITIKAINDGAVRIDAEGQTNPIQFRNNSFWTLEGFDACNGNAFVGGNGCIDFAGGNHGVHLRRMVAWNAGDLFAPSDICVSTSTKPSWCPDCVQVGATWTNNPTRYPGGCPNQHTIAVNSSNNVLLEDVAAFGKGRFNIVFYGAGPGTPNNGSTCRRCWGRWEGMRSIAGPEISMMMNYNQDAYNVTWENFIATWTGERDDGHYGSSPQGSFQTQVMRTGDLTTGQNILGGIAYVKPGAQDPFGNPSTFAGNNGNPNTGHGHVHYKNVVIKTLPGFTSSAMGFGTCSASPCVDNTADNMTLIGDNASTPNPTHWTANNILNATSLGTINIFTGASGGATICKRYTNRVLSTTDNLWPWPMDERIKAALAVAGSSALAGTAGTGYSAGTVTSEIVSIFGAIPSSCLGGNTTTTPPPPFVPPFPVSNDFPRKEVLDNFTRSDAATLGANWTVIGGTGFGVAANKAAPIADFSQMLWNTTFSTDQEAFVTLSVLPSPGQSETIINFLGMDVNNLYRVFVSRPAGDANDTVRVQKRVAGVQTDVISPVTIGQDFIAGDKLGVRVENQVITLYYNTAGVWYILGTAVDTQLPLSGKIGVSGNLPLVLDDFGGGGLVTAPTGSRPGVPSRPAAPSRPTAPSRSLAP